MSEMTDSSPINQLVTDLRQQIASAEAEAYADCDRYEEEARDRVRDRRERLFYELRPMRAQLDSIMRSLADIEARKIPAPIVIEMPSGTLTPQRT